MQARLHLWHDKTYNTKPSVCRGFSYFYIFLAVHLHIGISEWQNESLLQRILLKRFKESTKYIVF